MKNLDFKYYRIYHFMTGRKCYAGLNIEIENVTHCIILGANCKVIAAVYSDAYMNLSK